MHIRKIQIANIRCFPGDDQRVDIDLARPDGRHAGWTVFAGPNGSGKSTLLKAIALAALGPSAARALEPSFAGWIRHGAAAADASIEIGTHPTDRLEDADLQDTLFAAAMPGMPAVPTSAPRSFRADLRFSRATGNGPEPHVRAPDGAPGLAFCESGPWSDNARGWFLAGYGPYRRLSGHAADSMRLMAGPPRLSRVVSLFREDASLAECVEWLKAVYLRKLEGRAGAKELEEGVIALLNDGLLPGGTRVDRIDSEGLWTERAGVTLPLRELSDGYRTVAALVLDIVKQIHACHGDFGLTWQGGKPLVSRPGVVLLDEADMHLHVSWQQRIGFWLKEHFPEIQFLVTTHSPFICQAADPNGLIRLPAPDTGDRVEHLPEEMFKMVVQGGADDAALTALFGLPHTHSAASEALRRRIAELEVRSFRGSTTPGEEEELSGLRERLPQTGSVAVEQALRTARAAG